MRGNNWKLDWTEGSLPTIVYVFSPDCVWCERNFPAEEALAAWADGKYRFIGLSLSEAGLQEYVRDKHLAYPVYVVKQGSGVQEKLGVRGTPETLVVSSAGVVQNVWFGAFGEKSRKEIASSLGVTLPALKDE